MLEQRRHKRFKLDLAEINGKMILAHKVEIIDISIGGIALKTDRRLNIGKEYVIKLGNKTRSVEVKGVILRCELSGIEQIDNGEGVSIYTAGMMFKNVTSDGIADFLEAIEESKKQAEIVSTDRRMHIRFSITTPTEQILNFPAQFTVQIISLGGMLIQTDHALDRESLIPMDLSLLDMDATVNFTGRVASCEPRKTNGHEQYEIGVEFRDLADKDRALLQTFVNYVQTIEDQGNGKAAAS